MKLCMHTQFQILRFEIHNIKFSVMHILYYMCMCIPMYIYACIHCRLRCDVFLHARKPILTIYYIPFYIYIILIYLCIFALLIIILCLLRFATRILAAAHFFSLLAVVVTSSAFVNFGPLVHFCELFFTWCILARLSMYKCQFCKLM